MAEGATLVPPSLLEHLRWQARACAELGSPFYARLLDRVAEDLAAGGPSAEIFQSFARLSMEPVGLGTAGTEFLVSLQVWPGGVERRLGVAAPHGVPVTWEEAG